MTAPRIDHIGVVVADLDAALASMRPLFGEPSSRRELPDVGLRVAELQAANVVVELLEYTGGPASAFARETMGTAAGLNHLSVHTEDIAAGSAALAAAGLQPLPGFPRRGAHGTIAFFAPDAASGLRLELCQPDPERDGGH
ncbi:MAG: VOC family protein [Burkholderiaceae bacterium]